LADDTVMLTVGANLPSGSSDMSREEIDVSGLLSGKALGFRYNRLGEGLDIHLGGGFAQTYEPVTLGLGVGYLIKGEYAHLEDEAKSRYKPGNQVNLTGGADFSLNPLLFRSGLTYTLYQTDTENHMAIVQEGRLLSISGTAFLPMDIFSVLLSGRYANRGDTEFLSGNSEALERYGVQFDLSGTASYRMTEQLTLKLLLDGVLLGENDSGQNDASVFGFGAGLNLKFLRMSYVDVTGEYYTGSADDGHISLRGFSMTAALRVVL